MQWCDLASVNFIISALTDRDRVEHVLWIGAFRDNEIAEGHPIARALLLASDGSSRSGHVRLDPLTREHIRDLAVDALACAPDRADRIAAYLMDKSDGSPLFVRGLLTSLHDQGLVTFDAREECWSLHEEEIRSADLPSDVM